MEANRAPHAGSGPGGERLLAAHILLTMMDEQVPLDEAQVARALDPMWIPSLEKASDWSEGLYGMLRTASYYVLDISEAADAIGSMPPALPSFPPLPFKRIWIEARQHDAGRVMPAPYAIWQTDNEDGSKDHLEILGVAISEVQRGREWQVFIPWSKVKTITEEGEEIPLARIQAAAMAFHVTPHQILSPKEMVKGTQWHEGHLTAVLQLAINGAHLITARSVPKREVQLPRHQRKRLRTKRWAPRMPKLYYVDLAQAGEHHEEESGRTFRHRWLVSGHWYHHWEHPEHGEDLCTCQPGTHAPGRPREQWSATYKEPYVKGPPGAPWIGRPVHRG